MISIEILGGLTPTLQFIVILSLFATVFFIACNPAAARNLALFLHYLMYFKRQQQHALPHWETHSRNDQATSSHTHAMMTHDLSPRTEAPTPSPQSQGYRQQEQHPPEAKSS